MQAQSGLGWVRASADLGLSPLAVSGNGIQTERLSADSERPTGSFDGRHSDDLEMLRPIPLPHQEYASSLFFSTAAVRGLSGGAGPGAAAAGTQGVRAPLRAAAAAADAQAYSSGADLAAAATTVHTCRRRNTSQNSQNENVL